MTPLKRAMNTEGIRGLMMKGNVRLGEAPKTLKSTYKPKEWPPSLRTGDLRKWAREKREDALDSKKAAYQGHINKEMWVKDKMQQNKDAIKRFKDKFLKNEPKTVEDFRDKGEKRQMSDIDKAAVVLHELRHKKILQDDEFGTQLKISGMAYPRRNCEPKPPPISWRTKLRS